MRTVRAINDERGIALVMAVVFMLILLVVAANLIYYSTENFHAATYSRGSMSADSLAEAGINEAVSVLARAADPASPSLLAPRVSTYATGTVAWSGTYDGANHSWNVTSVGKIRNTSVASPGMVNRTWTAVIPLVPTTIQLQAPPEWSYIYQTGAPDNQCDLTVQNSAQIASALYANGHVCLFNSATITGGPVNVHGALYLANSQTAVGSKSARVNGVHVALGCTLDGSHFDKPCVDADRVYAVSGTSDLVPNPSSLAVPTVDWDYWYGNSSPGPSAGCRTVGGTPPAFDNNGARDNSLASQVNLTPSQSYTCQTTYGELSWNATTKTLKINGSIFFDGSAKVDSAGAISYTGQGTIFLSGTMYLKGTQLCGKLLSGACDSSWNPNQTFLAIAANGNGGYIASGDGIQLVTAGFQGGLYSSSGIDAGQYSDIDGGVVGNKITLGQKAQIRALSTPPSGLPGTQITTWSVGRPHNYG